MVAGTCCRLWRWATLGLATEQSETDGRSIKSISSEPNLLHSFTHMHRMPQSWFIIICFFVCFFSPMEVKKLNLLTCYVLVPKNHKSYSLQCKRSAGRTETNADVCRVQTLLNVNFYCTSSKRCLRSRGAADALASRSRALWLWAGLAGPPWWPSRLRRCPDRAWK